MLAPEPEHQDHCGKGGPAGGNNGDQDGEGVVHDKGWSQAWDEAAALDCTCYWGAVEGYPDLLDQGNKLEACNNPDLLEDNLLEGNSP